MPSTERIQSGTLVETDDSRLLVDCGSGVGHRLAQAGVDHRDVDTVLLTHHHLDHVADLPTLAKARWLDDHEDLTVIGPPKTTTVLDHLLSVDDMRDRVDLTVREHTVTDAPFEVAGLTVDCVETTHSKQCFAYRFGDDLVLSGDTVPNEDVFALADGVHTLIHECAYPDDVESEGHSTPTPLGRHLAQLDLERVYLTHLFPEAEAKAEEIRATVQEHVDADVRLAKDLDWFEIPG